MSTVTAPSWRDITIANRNQLRSAVIYKHKSMTNAAEELGLNYVVMVDTIAGRKHELKTVRALQDDFDLTDEQVLHLWPLLRYWPKEERQAS